MHPYFKDTWHKAIEPLGKTTRRRIIAAVIEYQFTGELPTDLCATATAIFNIIILEINPEATMAIPAPPRRRTPAPAADTEETADTPHKATRRTATPKPRARTTHLDYVPFTGAAPYTVPLIAASGLPRSQ